jgi:sarcosine oxidase subunit gamma
MLDAQSLGLPPTAHVQLAPQRSIVSIAAYKHTQAALRETMPLPVTPHCFAASGILFLWSGPASWLAISDEAGLEARIAEDVKGRAAVTDQSDGRAILRVTAPRAKLQKLVPIDLHESAFAANATALTLAGHIPVQIWQVDGAFEFCCFRSFAESLYHSLVEACEV